MDTPGPGFAAAVLDAVGGPANIDRFTHCMVRLRFELLDDALADLGALEAVPEVTFVVRQGWQLHLALSVPVPAAYHAVRAALDALDAPDAGGI